MALPTMMLSSSNLHLPRKCPNLISPIRSSSSSPRTKSIQFDLKSYWAKLISQINRSLDEAVSVQYPAEIYEAMRYSVLAEGAKQAPPIMCVAACELFGGNRLAAFPTACAWKWYGFFALILGKCVQFLTT